MSSDLIGLFAQVPIVAAVIWFVLQSQKNQQDMAKQNHNDWRGWLTSERESNEKFMTQQSVLLIAQLKAIADRLDDLESRRTEERRELLQVLRDFSESMNSFLKIATEHEKKSDNK